MNFRFGADRARNVGRPHCARVRHWSRLIFFFDSEPHNHGGLTDRVDGDARPGKLVGGGPRHPQHARLTSRGRVVGTRHSLVAELSVSFMTLVTLGTV